jgi:predicted MPP superfamily phosphohydrolase
MPLLRPQHPVVERIEINFSRLPVEIDGLKIVHLSDLHYDRRSDSSIILHAVETANRQRPDLVLITGDFLNLRLIGNGLRPKLDSEACARILRGLNARLGVFGVLGNHDKTEPHTLIHALEAAGIRVLHNSNACIESRGSPFWLVGVEDVLTGNPDLTAALSGIPSGSPTILLAHEPDFADVAACHGVTLQLSGHSHAGQVRFPGMPPAYLPPLGRKYPSGLRTIGPTKLYTNRGIGNSMLPIRLNCPPEVALITLRSVARHQQLDARPPLRPMPPRNVIPFPTSAEAMNYYRLQKNTE